MAHLALDQPARKRFMFTYFRGADVAQHVYLHQTREGAPSAAEVDLANVVEAYHRVVDRWVGEIRDRLPEDAVVIVVSDHGFNTEQIQEHPYKTGFHDFAPDGVFLSSQRRDDVPREPSAHIFDIAPTILALVGLPVHAGMEGRVVESVTPRTFSVEDWWSLRPAVYERGNPELTNPELEKFLKSLGYI